jgi:hypothetical protein
MQIFATFSPIVAGLPSFTSTVFFKEIREYTVGNFLCDDSHALKIVNERKSNH